VDERLMKATLEVDERHWWYRGRRRVIAAELGRLELPTAARVLDAGCGSGRTMVDLRRYGEVVGIELSEDAAEIARERDCGDVVIGRIEQLPFEDGTFDLITCLDVIEHTPDDRAALRELRRVAKPGGWALVTVPAYQALWSRHDEANHHYRRYSRAALCAAAVDAGWDVCRTTSFNSVLLAPAAVFRVVQRRRSSTSNGGASPELRTGPAWLNAALEAPLALEARWLARGGTLGAGLSLMVLLRNPPG
jgi:SAM-dependent methyltransferase